MKKKEGFLERVILDSKIRKIVTYTAVGVLLVSTGWVMCDMVKTPITIEKDSSLDKAVTSVFEVTEARKRSLEAEINELERKRNLLYRKKMATGNNYNIKDLYVGLVQKQEGKEIYILKLDDQSSEFPIFIEYKNNFTAVYNEDNKFYKHAQLLEKPIPLYLYLDSVSAQILSYNDGEISEIELIEILDQIREKNYESDKSKQLSKTKNYDFKI